MIKHNYENEYINFSEDKPIRFTDNFQITEKSKYGDNEWNFVHDHNDRLNIFSKCNFIINWLTVSDGTLNKRTGRQKYYLKLPQEIIEDLKLFVCIFYKFPALFKNKKNSLKQRKEATIVIILRNLARFISHIYITNQYSHGINRIKYLSDITFTDLEEALETYPYSSQSLYYLKLLCNSHVNRSLIYGEVKWNDEDIDNLSLDQRKHNIERIDTIPEKMFSLLTNSANNLIISFLSEFKEEYKNTNLLDQNQLFQTYSNFNEMINSYAYFNTNIFKEKNETIALYRLNFKKKFNCNFSSFSNSISLVQTAAITIILLYTGMRLSELLSLKKGCLIEINGIYYIKGTVTKGKPSNLPTDRDKWIAIDIVQSAITLLEFLAELNNNKYLFSKIRRVNKSRNNKPYSVQIASLALNKFLKYYDNQDEWKCYKLNPHKFRHTFAEALQKAGVGLPYITIQLKHLHHKLTLSPNQVTSSYGNYKENRFELLKNSSSGRFQILKNIYSENSIIAGGKADEFNEHSRAFFLGAALSGKELETYLKKLAEKNIDFIPTGLGICTMDWSNNKNVRNASPPCVSNSICLSECRNNVISVDIIPNLKGRLQDIENKLNDSSYSYLKENLLNKRDKLILLIDELSR